MGHRQPHPGVAQRGMVVVEDHDSVVGHRTADDV